MTKRLTALSAAAVALTIAVAGVVWAGQQDQPDVRVQAGGVDVQAEVDRQPRLRGEKAVIFRASALIGMNVQNSAEKNLGEINDLTINGNTGGVEYAAVSFGGFAGIGDKLFAVPWDALHLKRVGDAEDDTWVAVMDVTEATLEAAKGFNKDNWPDMADERWRTENDRTFRSTQRDRDATPRR